MGDDEEVKERILTFSRARFFQQGFVRVTVEDLTADLAISKKTFYKFFESKEDLVSAIISRTTAEIGGRVGAVIGSDKPFLEKLDEVMTVLGTLISRVGRPFQVDLQRAFPAQWKRVADFRRETLTTNIERLIAQGISEGCVPPEVNKRLFMLSYLASVEGVCRPDVLAGESFSMQEALRGILSLFFFGILTQESSEQLRHIQQRS
jgi:AcrR family transcriptional regulator